MAIHSYRAAHMAASEKRAGRFRVQTAEAAMPSVLLLLPDNLLETILMLLVPPWSEGWKRLAANKQMNKITATNRAFARHVAATKSLTRCFVVRGQIPASIPRWCSGVLLRDGFNEEGLQQLGGMCHNVSAFYLGEYPQLTDVGLSRLFAGCSSLTSLDVESSHITDEVFGLLAASAGMKHLWLSGCYSLRGIDMATACRNIVTLDLSYTGITATALSSVGSRFITRLYLAHSNLTDASLRLIADKSPNLTELEVTGCAVTNEGVCAVAARCPAIEILALEECDISDAAAQSICEGFPVITDLDLSGCPKITDAGLLALAAGCKTIRFIHLAGCNEINNSGRLEKMSQLPELRTLNLGGCGIGKSFIGVCGLVGACPNVTTLCLGSAGVTSI